MMPSSQGLPFRLEGLHCRMQIESPRPSVVVVRIEGRDVGEFGARPMQAVEQLLGEGSDGRLFIDARNVSGAAIDVSNAWSQWLGQHRTRFARIEMLTQSQYVRVTAEFVRRFADLRSVMTTYTDVEPWEASLRRATEP